MADSKVHRAWSKVHRHRAWSKRTKKQLRLRLREPKITMLDMAAKRRKKHKNQISGLIISMGYET
jgi:hypothetical protein